MLLSGNLLVYPIVIALPLLVLTIGLILFLRQRGTNRREVTFDYETTAPKLAIESEPETKPSESDDDEAATETTTPTNPQQPQTADAKEANGLWDRVADQVYPFRDRRE